MGSDGYALSPLTLGKKSLRGSHALPSIMLKRRVYAGEDILDASLLMQSSPKGVMIRMRMV
eukprot:CAMPEP_0183325588 /NCGR_PEP_ID=MMETSP0160_2-20130417/79955_1 /TAXON_ID=2839 ORGANISM="Odontella Sinensis, Strain Grunow 1884" /NCGR_SAMPLE_ID=MMETSP0160_2 /ASSEMBLY_ACC=CAM_ASM_000250 /LENGTH=60 /DNA_ID=CAMNT_0025493395 /DNA_START=566 /DNA_END=748 /DNA_ORIENTATION=-